MRCYMSGCTNDSRLNKNVYYFKFPTLLEMQNLWKSICKIETIGGNARICSLHFKTCDIVQRGGQICLVKTALPICYERNLEAANLLKIPTCSSGNMAQSLESSIVTTGSPKKFSLEKFQHRFIIQLPEPNATPSIKSVSCSMFTQTNTNLCGSVEISECSTEYRLNCFYCCKTFLLEKWFQFVDHVKKQHFKIPKFPNCDHDYTTVGSATSNISKSSESIKNLTPNSYIHGINRNLRAAQTDGPTSLRFNSIKRKITSETESEDETELTPSTSCVKEKVKPKQSWPKFSPPSNADAAKEPPVKKIIVTNKDEYIAKKVVQQTLRNIREFEARYKTVKTKPPKDIFLGRSSRTISSGVCYIKNIAKSTVTQKQTSTKKTPLNRCLKRANTETNETLPDTNQTENQNHSELVFNFTPREIIIDLLDNIKEFPILWEFHNEPNNEDYAKTIQNLCTKINEKWSLTLSALQMRCSINRILAFYRFMLPCKNVQMFKEYFEKCSKFLPSSVRNIPRKRCVYCDICYVKDSDIRKHLTNVHQYLKWQYKCDYCAERFMTNDEYKLHKSLPHYIEVHRCNKCNARFNRRQSLNKHISKCHEKPGRVSLASITKKPSELSKHKTQYKCHLCEKKYNQKFTLVMHLKKHRHQLDFICEFCGKAFLKRSGLNSHMGTHTGEKVTCNICNLQLRKISLSRHLRLVHVACEGTIESTFRAKNHRYKKFSEHYSRPAYNRSKETKPRKYDCKKCNVHFDRLKLLKDHNNIIHCNQRVMHCRICNVAFKYLNNMRRHYAKVHKLHSVQTTQLIDMNQDLDKVLQFKIEESNETTTENLKQEQFNDPTNHSTSIQDEIMKAIENIEKEEIKTDDGSMNDFLSDLLKH